MSDKEGTSTQDSGMVAVEIEDKNTTTNPENAGEIAETTTETPTPKAAFETETPADGKTASFNPKTDWFRWVVLLVVVLLYVATSFAKNTAKTMSKDIVMTYGDHAIAKSTMTTNPGPFRGLVYESALTIHSMPGMFFALVAGVLVDRYGATLSLMTFTLLCFIGQLICGFGVLGENGLWPVFLIGRFLNGAGTCAFRVATNVLMKNWFADSQLAFAMSFSRIGDIVAMLTESSGTPAIAKSTDTFAWPFFVGAILLGACVAGIFVLNIKPLPKKETEEEKTDFFTTIGRQLKKVYRDARGFPAVYWNLLAVLFFYDGISTATQSLMMYYLTNQYGIDSTVAANIRPLPKYAAVLGPFIGMVIDRYGKRSFILITSGFCLAIFNIAMFLGEDQIEDESARIAYCCFAMIFLGLVHSFFSCVLWPNFGRVVNKKVVGSAYGLASAMNCLSVSLIPLLVSQFRLNGQLGYGQLFCMGFVFIGIGFSFNLWYFFGHLIKTHLRPTKEKNVSTTFEDIKDELDEADRMDKAFEDTKKAVAEDTQAGKEETSVV